MPLILSGLKLVRTNPKSKLKSRSPPSSPLGNFPIGRLIEMHMGMEERTDLVFEARKEKKKRKEKRKKGELDANSSLIEVLEDKIGEVVKVQKFKKSDGTNRESEEGATKKKKRKRDVEGTDVEIQMNLTKEQELINDCENPNGKIMEEVDCADTEKKRKKHFEVDKIGDTAKRSKHSKDRDVTEMKNVEVGKRKKKKKEKREKVVGELLQNIITEGKEAGVESEHSEGQILKKAKKNHRKNSRSEMQETVYLGTKSGRFLKDGFLEKDGATLVTDESSSKTREDVNEGDGNKKRKRAKSEKHVNKGDCDKEKKKKAKSFKGSIRPPKKVTTSDLSENSTPRKAPKRVSFSDEVEVFSPSDDQKDAEDKKKLVWGKRFSKDEDELIKKAVHTYIEEHQLGSREEGIEKILKCNKCPEIRNCWKHIAEALPWRPYRAVYARGHNLFERSMDPKWTEEELNEVKLAAEEFEAKGMRPNWTKLAIKLGKYRVHVKDAYRRVKLANMKKGSFSQEEYQTLFDLVNKDLQMRALQEKKSKHGMLRDNIAFEAISQCMGTRTNAILCQKWYYQLASPMVAEGEWKDADDYLLIYALDSLDAFCIEDVDWDDLLEHRSGDVCRKRWNQMVKHIGQHGTKSFTEQLEILSKRYCADALEARKVYDSKPVVD